MSATSTPTPNALAAASVTDLVPQPPSIPAFRPFMSFINQLATQVEKLFPAYEPDPILAPSQVAAGWVVAINQILQGTYWNGSPTPFTVPVYILMVAAYQRYQTLATNHLPTAPQIVSTGPLPGTYKLQSTDPDGDPLTYTVDLAGQPNKGAILMGLDGTFSYVPTLAGLRDGEDVTFTVHVSDILGAIAHPIAPDGYGADFVVSFHYEGSGINEFPTWDNNGEPKVVSVNVTTGVVSGSSHATDPDGDSLTYSGIALWGDVVVNADGSFTYTPTAAARHTAAGSVAASLGLDKDLVTITVNDGNGGIIFKSVSVPITASNQGPTGDPVDVGDPEPILGTVIGKVTAHDGDGDGITYGPVLFTTSKGGTVAVSLLTGDFSYLPSLSARHAAGADGATDEDKKDTFTLTASDGHGGTVDFEVTVDIAPGLEINSFPKFTDGPQVTNTNSSNGVVTGTFTVTDSDGDTLNFSASNILGALYGSVTVTNGTFTYTPTAYARHSAASLPVTDVVTIAVNDGHGGITLKSVTVSVLSSNQGPSVDSVTVNDPEPILGTVTGKVKATDADGDIISYGPVLFTTSKGGTVTVSLLTGDFSYLPSLSARHAAGADGATDDDKQDTFTLTASDGHGGTVDFEVTVDVAPGLDFNAFPTFTSNPTVTNTNNSNGVVTGTFTVTDADGDTLHYTATNLLGPLTGSVTVTNGTFTYTPTAAARHTAASIPFSDTVTITVTDGHGGIAFKTVQVAITSDNTGPTVTDVDVDSPNGLGIVTGKITASDPDDGDILTFGPITFTTTKGGLVTVGSLTGTFSYAPSLTARHLAASTTAGADDKKDSFTITVSDGHGGTVDVPITVDILGANNGPGGLAIVGLPDSNGVVRGSVEGTDLDFDSLSYSLVNGSNPSGATTNSSYSAGGGIVQLAADGSFTFIPKPSTAFIPGLDTDSFYVTVTDGHGGSATVKVVPLANLSIGTSVTTTAPNVENGKLNVNGSNTGLLNFSLGSGAGKGTVVVNADGTYTYTRTSGLGHNITAADSFTIIGTDANGKSITVATVNVSPPLVNTAPSGSGSTTVSDTSLIPRGVVLGTPVTPATQTTTGTFSATDPDGDAVSFAGGIYGTTRGGTVTVTSSGGFLYSWITYSDAHHKASADNAPAADKVDTVTLNVSDGYGGTTAITFSVPLATYNDAPSSNVSVGSADSLGVVRGSVSGSDDDGDTVTYSLVNVGNPSGATTGSTYTTNGGVVQLKSDGTFTYIPTTSASSTDSFKVTVYDGHGGSTTATVNVPIVTPSTTTTGTSTNVQSGKLTIPTGDVGLLSYSKGSDGGKGTAVVNADGSYTYTRNGALGHTTSPADTFTIKGTDVNGKIVTLTVSVAPPVANNVPAAGGTTVTSSSLDTIDIGINRQQTSAGTLSATDADGDSVTFTAGTYNTTNGGTVTVTSTGSFTYKSPKKLKDTIFGGEDSYWHAAAVPGAPGDTFSVTVSDGFGGTVSLSYSVPIETLNKVPDASVSVGNRATDALGVVRGTVTGSDDDSDNLTYSLVGGVNGVAATGNGGIIRFTGNSFTYIPTAGKATDSFQVLVNDGHGGTSTATVSLTGLSTPSAVTGVNTSTPNIVTGQLNTDGNTGLTYSVGSQGGKGTVTVTSTGGFTYTRDGSLGHTQTPGDSFTIKATDGNGNSVIIATVNVTPTVANSAPVANGITVTTSTGPTLINLNTAKRQTTTGTLKTTDSNGDTVTFTAGTYDTTNGGSITVDANGGFSYTITKSTSTVFYPDEAKYWHTSAADGNPGDVFQIAVTDGFGGNTTLSFAIPIKTENTAPSSSVSAPKTATSTLGVVTGTLSGSDDDGDAVTFSLVGATGGSVKGSNGGIISLTGSTYTYVPTAGKTTDTFYVNVNDGHGGTTQAQVSLSGLVTPTIFPSSVVTTGVNTVTVQLTVPASDSALLTFAAGNGTAGTVTKNANGTFTYNRTAAGHSAPMADTFTITATDSSGKQVTMGTVTVTPQAAANNVPTISLSTAPGPNSGMWNSGIYGLNTSTWTQTAGGKVTVGDLDGDTLTFSATNTNGATVSFQSDGTFTYTMVKNFDYFHAAAKVFTAAEISNGTANAAKNATFTVTVSDAFGGTASVNVTVPIFAYNNPPTISGGTKFITVSTITVDEADGDTLTFTPGGSSFTFGGRGLPLSTLWSGSTLTVSDGYYVVSNGVVTSQTSVSKTW